MNMVDYLNREKHVSKQLQLASEKVSKNMLTSVVFEVLLSEYDRFKTISVFTKKNFFAEVQITLESFTKKACDIYYHAKKLLLCTLNNLALDAHCVETRKSYKNWT